jgi:hypothetical protein
MTNLMHKFLKLFYLSIDFCLTEQFHPSMGADTIPRKLEPLPKLYACHWRWAKRKPETCKAEVNR